MQSIFVVGQLESGEISARPLEKPAEKPPSETNVKSIRPLQSSSMYKTLKVRAVIAALTNVSLLF
jgi:hypothetical protein